MSDLTSPQAHKEQLQHSNYQARDYTMRGGQSKNDSTEIDDLFGLLHPIGFAIKSLRAAEKIFNNEWFNAGLKLPQRISTGWPYANGAGTRCTTCLLAMRMR